MTGSTQQFWTLPFLTLLAATTAFTATYYLLLPVLPVYMDELGANKLDIGLIMGLFFFGSLFLRVLAGILGDRYGRKGLLWSCVALSAATPLFFIKPSLAYVALMQLVFGYTIGVFTVSSISLLTENVDGAFLGRAVGIHSIALILGKGLMPSLGLYLHREFGLWTVVGLSASFTVLTALLLPLTREERQVQTEGEKETPFRDILKNPYVIYPGLILFVITFTNGTIITMLPLFAKEVHISGFEWFFTVNAGAIILSRLLMPKIIFTDEVGIVKIALAFIIVSVSALGFSKSLPYLLTQAFLYGLGFGLMYPALTVIVLRQTPPSSKGSALGLFTSFFDIGVTAGSFWAGLSEFWGFQRVYLSAAILPIVGFLLLSLKTTKKSNSS
ncbi:MFS transporter [Heliobacterium chlorum]|uniref:MFS transporter n=1 Tax=Heliobacterium chlorum TaxID=2698 RepID=A0ABR7T230_HELCL|nr:MFS transporter [Heliobacterium chlorum]MBC9784073.1 MFS transporter [Heliobacterium chlorum]